MDGIVHGLWISLKRRQHPIPARLRRGVSPTPKCPPPSELSENREADQLGNGVGPLLASGDRTTVVVSEQGKVITGWANRSTGQEEQVNSDFSFLCIAHADLLNEILARRRPTLHERFRRANSVSRSDAEEIMSVISDEFTENVDDE